MDVFIMSCVSHSNPSLHISLPPYLFHSLAHLSSSACVLHLADRDLISTLQPRCYSLSHKEDAFSYVCTFVFVSPSSASTTQSHPSTFVAKARV